MRRHTTTHAKINDLEPSDVTKSGTSTRLIIVDSENQLLLSAGGTVAPDLP